VLESLIQIQEKIFKSDILPGDKVEVTVDDAGQFFFNKK